MPTPESVSKIMHGTRGAVGDTFCMSVTEIGACRCEYSVGQRGAIASAILHLHFQSVLGLPNTHL